MSASTQQAIEIFSRLNEKEQDFALNLLKQIAIMHDAELKEHNDAYLAKIRRGIKQCTEGRGIQRDIIEVDDE